MQKSMSLAYEFMVQEFMVQESGHHTVDDEVSNTPEIRG